MESVVYDIEAKCPSCGNQFTTKVYLIVDAEDEEAKAMVLNKLINVAQCPYCGSVGLLNMPFVYHDGEKELFLVYTPNAMSSMQRKSKDSFIGEATRILMNKLPPEERKGYLFQPKEFLSLDSLIREILHADGLSDEEIERRKRSLDLYNKLLDAAGEESRIKALVEENPDLVDGHFLFSLISMVDELKTELINSDEEKELEKLEGMLNWLLDNTEGGKEVKVFNEQIGKAMKAESPEELFDALLGVPESLWYEAAIASTPMINEEFFELLSEEILNQEKINPEKAEKLRRLREVYMNYYEKTFETARKSFSKAQKLLDRLLESDNLELELKQSLSEVLSPMFHVAWKVAHSVALESGNESMVRKLEELQNTLAKVAAGEDSAEGLLYSLMLAGTSEEVQAILQARRNAITPEFFKLLDEAIATARGKEEKRLLRNIKAIAMLVS